MKSLTTTHGKGSYDVMYRKGSVWGAAVETWGLGVLLLVPCNEKVAPYSFLTSKMPLNTAKWILSGFGQIKAWKEMCALFAPYVSHYMVHGHLGELVPLPVESIFAKDRTSVNRTSLIQPLKRARALTLTQRDDKRIRVDNEAVEVEDDDDDEVEDDDDEDEDDDDE